MQGKREEVPREGPFLLLWGQHLAVSPYAAIIQVAVVFILYFGQQPGGKIRRLLVDPALLRFGGPVAA